MSLKHAILGFLSFKPLSGYDLKKAFDNAVRHGGPANQSQIYRTLTQMTKEGLLEKEVIFSEDLEIIFGKRPYDDKKIIEPVKTGVREDEIAGQGRKHCCTC